MRLSPLVLTLLLSGCVGSASDPSSSGEDPSQDGRSSERPPEDTTPGWGVVNLTLDQPVTEPVGWFLGTGENCFVVAPYAGDWVVNITATLTWAGAPSEMTLLVYNTYTDKTIDRVTGKSPLTVDLRDLSDVDGEHVSVVAQLPDVSIEPAEDLEMSLAFEYDWHGRVPQEGMAYCAVYLPYGLGIGSMQVPP